MGITAFWPGRALSPGDLLYLEDCTPSLGSVDYRVPFRME